MIALRTLSVLLYLEHVRVCDSSQNLYEPCVVSFAILKNMQSHHRPLELHFHKDYGSFQYSIPPFHSSGTVH